MMNTKTVKVTKEMIENGVIGYKGFKRDVQGNLRCRSMIYYEGKLHSIDYGTIRICGNGMHYCKNIMDVDDYYSFNDDNTEVYKVLDIGVKRRDRRDKSVTNKLIVLEKIDLTKLMDTTMRGYHENGYDIVERYLIDDSLGAKAFYKNGKLVKTILFISATYYDMEVHYCDDEENVIRIEYVDSLNAVKNQSDDYKIKEFNSDGVLLTELKYDEDDEDFIKKYYDKDGNVILRKEWDDDDDEVDAKIYKVSGKCKSIKHDERGNIIYKMTADGDEYFYKYDENNNMIYKKDDDGDEYFYKYDERGNMIYKKDEDDDEWEYKYDENNNMIYKKDDDGDEYFYKYDERGNMIYKRDDDGDGWERKYDHKNRMLYEKKTNGEISEYKYDENDNKIYSNEDGDILYFDYDSSNRLTKKYSKDKILMTIKYDGNKTTKLDLVAYKKIVKTTHDPKDCKKPVLDRDMFVNGKIVTEIYTDMKTGKISVASTFDNYVYRHKNLSFIVDENNIHRETIDNNSNKTILRISDCEFEK